MKKTTLFLLISLSYAILLALSLNHNSINLKPTDAPRYIGRNSLNKIMNKQRKFLLVLPLLVIPFLTMAFWALGGVQTPSTRPANTGIDVTLPQAQFKKEPDASKMSVYQAALRDSFQNGVSHGFLNSVAEKLAADQSADRIQAKLAELNQQLAQPAPTPYSPPDDEAQVRKLHQMARSLKTTRQEDPEMAQLSHMLTQLQAVQNPWPTDTQYY